MNIKTKNLALAGILTSMTFLLGMTPIGLIPLGIINLTIMCIPVIIGTLVCGLKIGLLLGAAFGLSSTLTAFGISLAAQGSLSAALIPYSPFAVILMSMIPRLMIPIVSHFVFKSFSKKKHSFKPIAIGIATAAGSLTNTVLYLGSMYLFYMIFGLDTTVVAAFIAGTGVMAGPAEALVAVIICVPVVSTVLRSKKSASYKKNMPTPVKSKHGNPYNQKAYNQKANLVAPKGTQNVTPTPIFEDEELSTLVNIASMPSADIYYNADTDIKKRLIAKGTEYLEKDALDLSFSMFTRYISEFSEESMQRARFYVLIRYIDSGKYDFAAKVLRAILTSGAKCDETDKRVLTGTMRIIHSSKKEEINDIDNAKMREKFYEKVIFYIEHDQCVIAGQLFSRYLEVLS
ncbi:MAG: ECF transporter S component [Clostridia bacterium]